MRHAATRASGAAHIALSEFSKEILVRAGLPRERIHLKGNFGATPPASLVERQPRMGFAGQIARFKGIHVLLEAWTRLAAQGQQLTFEGDGDDRAELERRYAMHKNIVWQGSQPRDKVIQFIAESRWLALPSLAYENFPMSVLEAFSVGTPVIVPSHGAFAAMVTHDMEGLQFAAGDASDLERTLRMALGASEQSWSRWSLNARSKFLREYTERCNYQQLMDIYHMAVEVCLGARDLGQQAEVSAALAPVERSAANS